jgi:hypothetical protein
VWVRRLERKGRRRAPIHYPFQGKGNSFVEIKHFENCPKFQTLYVTEPF